MSTVDLNSVRKSYGSLEVIHGISMHIPDGQFVALVGPSGCGKSTLLRMVAGLEDISGGEIMIGDRVVNDVAPKDRDIAMVFQNYALYPHMNVRNNMGFALKQRRRWKGRNRGARAQRRRGSSGLRPCWTASRARSRAASANGWPWAGPSCVTRTSSCSTSRFPTWTPSFGFRCVPRSRNSISGWARRRST